ncbi:MAG: hypothetical protein MZV63_19285 [Marinilabiliales bacterium]|nr:hypothetical protein [Marinilabiliales bacterium]
MLFGLANMFMTVAKLLPPNLEAIISMPFIYRIWLARWMALYCRRREPKNVARRDGMGTTVLSAVTKILAEFLIIISRQLVVEQVLLLHGRQTCVLLKTDDLEKE